MDSFQKNELRRLFDIAAAMSMAMDCSLNAEPEMLEFVQFLRTSDKYRQELPQILRESFSDEFYMNSQPIELWRFCLHSLRWPELRSAIVNLKEADIEANGASRSNVWDSMLEAYEDDWEGAQYFKSFSDA